MKDRGIGVGEHGDITWLDMRKYQEPVIYFSVTGIALDDIGCLHQLIKCSITLGVSRVGV